jgi:hypothetical protein
LLQQAEALTDQNSRMVLSEVTIRFLPVTEASIDLGHYHEDGEDEKGLYHFSIYGFENAIPPDWRFLNWERVIFLCLTAFLLVLVGVFGFFAFAGL